MSEAEKAYPYYHCHILRGGKKEPAKMTPKRGVKPSHIRSDLVRCGNEPSEGDLQSSIKVTGGYDFRPFQVNRCIV